MTSGPVGPDWKRLDWAFGAIFLVIATPVAASFVRSFRPAPLPQPMRFSHKAHAAEAECGACHLHAETLAAAGMPALSDCVDCHEGTQSKKAADKREEAKLEHYVKNGKEIPWVLLPRLTPDIFFSHRRHVTVSKMKCANCHGPIERADTAPRSRVTDFSMNWCMHCHKVKEASVDCLACHR